MNKYTEKILRDKFGNFDEINFDGVEFRESGPSAFEIIYDQRQVKIIGFKEIDAKTLTPRFDDGGEKIGWTQNYDIPNFKRELNYTQILFWDVAEHREEQLKKLLDGDNL